MGTLDEDQDVINAVFEEQEESTTFIERAQQRTTSRINNSEQDATTLSSTENTQQQQNQPFDNPQQSHECRSNNSSNVKTCNCTNSQTSLLPHCYNNNNNNNNCNNNYNRNTIRQCCCSRLLRFLPQCSCNTKKSTDTSEAKSNKQSKKPIIKYSPRKSLPPPPSHQETKHLRNQKRYKLLEPKNYSLKLQPVSSAFVHQKLEPVFSISQPLPREVYSGTSNLPRRALFRTRSDWNRYQRPILSTIPSSSYRVNAALSEMCSSIKVTTKAKPCSQCPTQEQQTQQQFLQMFQFQNQMQYPAQRQNMEELCQSFFDQIPDPEKANTPSGNNKGHMTTTKTTTTTETNNHLNQHQRGERPEHEDVVVHLPNTEDVVVNLPNTEDVVVNLPNTSQTADNTKPKLFQVLQNLNQSSDKRRIISNDSKIKNRSDYSDSLAEFSKSIKDLAEEALKLDKAVTALKSSSSSKSKSSKSIDDDTADDIISSLTEFEVDAEKLDHVHSPPPKEDYIIPQRSTSPSFGPIHPVGSKITPLDYDDSCGFSSSDTVG